MQKKKRRFEVIDLALLILSLLCCLASSTALYLDYMSEASYGQGKVPIGKISSLSNIVKRKFSSSLVWHQATKGATLFENDWIFTGANSMTQILFDDGGTLTVDPGSIIVLTRDKGKLQLDLQHGSFIADLKSKTNISITKNGIKEVISAGENRIKVTEDKKISQVSVLEGLAANFKGEEIKQNEQITFDGESVEKKELFISLLSPQAFSTVWRNQSSITDFSWESSEEAESYTVEVAENDQFKNPFRKTVTSTNLKIKIPLNGLVYWRVRAQLEDKEFISDTSSFSIRLNTAPNPVLPIHLSQIKRAYNDVEKPDISFEWRDQDRVWSHYRLQIASDIEFKNIVSEHKDLITEIYRVTFEKSGKHFWRLQGLHYESGQRSNWSRIHEFDLSIRRPIVHPPVALNQPKIYYTLNNSDIKKIDRENFIDLKPKKKKLDIRWRDQSKAKSYEIKISRSEDFDKSYKTLTSQKPEIRLESSYLGKIFFQITPQYDNFDSAEVATGTIYTFLPAPILKPVTYKNKKYFLKWNAVNERFHYELNHSSDPKKKKFKTAIIVNNGAEVDRETRFLDWKVRLVDRETEEPYSFFAKDSYEQKILEPTRTITSKELIGEKVQGDSGPKFSRPPKKKTFLVSKGESAFVLFRWNFHKKMKNYDLEFSHDEKMNQILFTKSVKKTKYVLRKPLEPGLYYYRVQGRDGDIKTQWSEVRMFRVLSE